MLTSQAPLEPYSWPPTSPGPQQKQSDLTAATDVQRAQRLGRCQPEHRFLSGVPRSRKAY